jgi:hypothetical protein
MGTVGEDLRRVGAGLRLVLLGLATMAINGLAHMILAFSLAEPGQDLMAKLTAFNQDRPATAMVLTGLSVLSVVLGITGKVYCLAVPAAAAATPLIMLALGCSTLGLVLSIAGTVSTPGESAFALLVVSIVLSVLGYLFFLRFLRLLAAYLGAGPLARRVASVQLGTMAIGFALMLFWAGVAAGIGEALAVLVLLMMVGVLIVFVKYTRVILELWRTTEAAADAAGDQD